MRTTLARHKTVGSVEYVRSFDYDCAGKSVHVTDEIDISLVKPRERKYEQAGAASAVAQGASTSTAPPAASTANAKLEVR
jgi:succinate dehydrogenase / fumarate reductase, flavoprotein subunit